MKYLKYFKTDADYQNYYNSDDFVTPNVSYVEDTDVVYYSPNDLIIMTSESNPEVMKVCYNQGWAKSPSEMYASEAAKVTSIGTAFESLGNGGSDSGYSGSNISFTFSFDEFKYFTGVDSIVNKAFERSNIVSITIPNSVTSIGEYAFSDCSSLTSITIPNSVTSIGDDAFIDCSSLTSITIPNSVTSIGGGAFCRCSSLTSITIPNSVTSIGGGAFNSCSSLTSITIPNSVTSISQGMFYACSSLTSITIPNSVTSIGSGAFRACSNLNEITCLATTAPSIVNDTFVAVKPSGLLRKPAGSNYISWLSSRSYYLGYYNWTTEEI